MTDFEANRAILDRAAEILGFSGHGSKKELADYLGVSTATLSGWRSRNQIDYDVLRKKLTDGQFLYATTGKRIAPGNARVTVSISSVRRAVQVVETALEKRGLHEVASEKVRDLLVQQVAQGVELGLSDQGIHEQLIQLLDLVADPNAVRKGRE